MTNCFLRDGVRKKGEKFFLPYEGCRICGSVVALQLGTFYSARHFLLKDEKWCRSKVFFCQALFMKILKVRN